MVKAVYPLFSLLVYDFQRRRGDETITNYKFQPMLHSPLLLFSKLAFRLDMMFRKKRILIAWVFTSSLGVYGMSSNAANSLSFGYLALSACLNSVFVEGMLQWKLVDLGFCAKVEDSKLSVNQLSCLLINSRVRAFYIQHCKLKGFPSWKLTFDHNYGIHKVKKYSSFDY